MSTVEVRRAWGWVAALRDGAATPWREWRGEAEPWADVLPGAQQLELLRRINQTRPGGHRLADRVLAADAPGRGRSDVPLAGVGEPRFGPAPMDPGDLGAEELLRIAAGLLADDLAKAGLSPRRDPRRRPWAPAYQLAGDDWLVAPVRDHLRQRARPEQPHSRRVFVLGTDLATMLADAWTARAFAESGAGWSTWLGRFAADDRLPARADLTTIARGWAEAIGRHRVTIVTDPGRMQRRLRLIRRRIPEPPPVTAAGVDLTRRISTTLGILVPDEERTRLLREVLLPRLPQDPAARVAVPPQWHDWVRARADRMRNDLLADGYPVIGDLDRLVPLRPAEGADPSAAEALELALGFLVDPQWTEEG